MDEDEQERVDCLKEHFESKFNISKMSSTSLFKQMLTALEEKEFSEDSN